MKTIDFIQNGILSIGILFSVLVYSQSSPTGNNGISDVIKDDFLVSDNITGEYWEREELQVAMNAAGESVVVWCDERNGDYDVFAQRYNSSGTAIGSSFRVNDDSGDSDQDHADVAINDVGEFIFGWHSNTNIGYQIFCRLYNSDGTPMGSSFQVSDVMDSPHARRCCVAICANGEFAVAWNDSRDGDSDVFAQVYNNNGNPLGVNFRVNEDGGTEYGSIPPGIGMDENGNFVICWSDDRFNEIANVFAQQYTSDGSPVGTNFIANDTLNTGISSQVRPEMAMNKNGEFVIVWKDYRNGSKDFWAQRFDASANASGENFRITDDSPDRNPEDVSVAISEDGNMVFTWYDDYNDWWGDVFAQRVDASGNPVGGNFIADDYNGYGIQEYPTVGIGSNNNFIICFSENKEGDTKLIGINYDWQGNVQGSSFAIFDDNTIAIQEHPAIEMNSSGNFVIAWMDDRDDFFFDIFIQRYNASGNAIGTNTLVNDDGNPNVANQHPDIGISDNGNFAVVWEDSRGYNDNIYAQRFSSDGTDLGENFIVNDDGANGAYQLSPAIAMDGTGNFVMAWVDDRDDGDIYAQRYSADGTAIGGNFIVNDNQFPSNQYMGDVAMNNSGSFIIVWVDDQLSGKIHAQLYNPEGTLNGVNFICSESTDVIDQYNPSVDMDDAGNFIIAWEDRRNNSTNIWETDIYARIFEANGTPLSPDFRVNDDETMFVQKSPSVTVAPEGGKFMIAWTDYRKEGEGPEFMAQKYFDGLPDGDNIIVNNPDLFPNMHQKTNPHSLASNNNSVAYAWADNRRHKHWDIYAKLTDWQGVGVKSHNSPISCSVYPNPCSEEINIVFENNYFGEVHLQVSDLSGEEILSQKYNKNWEMFKEQINVSSYNFGVYMLTVTCGTIVYSNKIIKSE